MTHRAIDTGSLRFHLSPDDTWIVSFPIMSSDDVADTVDRARIAAQWCSGQHWWERKRCLLECGGKCAAIIDRSNNLEKATELIASGTFSNSGPTCVRAERVHVHKAVYSEFMDLLTAKVRLLTPGAAANADYRPMTVPAQIDVVACHLDDVVANSGQAMVGSPESIRDRYIAPLVFTGNVESSLAAWEETSGPALMVNPVQDMGEAIAPTSANQCGLAASVLSGSRVASEATAR